MILAIVCYFLQLVPFVFYTILCLFLVYLLYLLGLHLFAAKHPERKWPTKVLKTLERPLFFIVDFFETPSGKRVIDAGIQLSIVAIGVSSKGFEQFINGRIFKSIPAPYSAQVSTKLIHATYMIVLIMATLHKMVDPLKLDFWSQVVLHSFATVLAWERFRN